MIIEIGGLYRNKITGMLAVIADLKDNRIWFHHPSAESIAGVTTVHFLQIYEKIS